VVRQDLVPKGGSYMGRALLLSLLVPQKFGRRHRTAFYLLLALGPVFVVDADGGLQLLPAFFFAAHVNQHLPPHIVDVGTGGIELAGGINGA
jgi:hypothetical protein